MSLLSKTRKINALLQNAKGQNFKEMSETLRDVIDATIFIVSLSGKILGYSLKYQFQHEKLNQLVDHGQFPEEFINHLSQINETTSNIDVDSVYSVFPSENKDLFVNGLTTIVPLIGGGKRIGTFILARLDQSFENDDLILAEYGSTVVGMEILHGISKEIEKEARSKAVVQMAIGSLSYSELEAIEHIFKELEGKEGVLVASKIADRVGITRSVIVNALRKLESAGVIESRSLGMKGTYLKVLNDKFLVELEKLTSDNIRFA